MKLNENQQAFIALVKAGLWEKEVRISPSNIIDFKEVLRIAEEQSVIDLLATGIEKIDVRSKKEEIRCKIPKDVRLTFVGGALQIEQQNVAMNQFVAELIAKLKTENVRALLVKGQGGHNVMRGLCGESVVMLICCLMKKITRKLNQY